MRHAEILRVRKDNPNRLVHREGKTVTVAFVRETYDELYHAAGALRATHYSAKDGWDTKMDWVAFMMLIYNAEFLTGSENIMIPNDPANLDPDETKKWKPKDGRAQKQKKEIETQLTHQAQALRLLPMLA